MRQTTIPLARERVGLTSNLNDKSFKYEGKHGSPYNYAIPWKFCNKCGKKDQLTKYCRGHNTQGAEHNRNRQKIMYQYQESIQTPHREQTDRT